MTKAWRLAMTTMLVCGFGAGMAMRLLLFSGKAAAQGIAQGQSQERASFSSANWVTETVESEGDVGEWQSLALGSSDLPRISYFDATQDSLTYAILSGTTWVTSTVDTDVGGGSSLALDGSGIPHIAYMHNGPAVHYAVLSGNTWLLDTVDFAIGAGQSLALDGAGDPHIAYCGFGPQNGINYVSRTTSGWTRESVDDINCGGSSPSLALDRLDRPHISYYDAANDDLKYAHLQYRIHLPLTTRS